MRVQSKSIAELTDWLKGVFLSFQKKKNPVNRQKSENLHDKTSERNNKTERMLEKKINKKQIRKNLKSHSLVTSIDGPPFHVKMDVSTPSS